MTVFDLLYYTFPLAHLDYSEKDSEALKAYADAEYNNECFWRTELSDDTIESISQRLMDVIHGIKCSSALEFRSYIKKKYEEMYDTSHLDSTKETITWTKIPTEILNDDCQHIMEIIDDASVHGLNFKYVNGEWYFGETQEVPN